MKTKSRKFVAFIALIGVSLTLLGVRYTDTGLNMFLNGRLTVFNGKSSYIYVDEPYFPKGNEKYRIDLDKDFDVDKLLADCGAKVKIIENNIIYAYSPLIKTNVWVHNKKINMMIHLGENAVNVGVPLLIGSF